MKDLIVSPLASVYGMYRTLVLPVMCFFVTDGVAQGDVEIKTLSFEEHVIQYNDQASSSKIIQVVHS